MSSVNFCYDEHSFRRNRDRDRSPRRERDRDRERRDRDRRHRDRDKGGDRDRREVSSSNQLRKSNRPKRDFSWYEIVKALNAGLSFSDLSCEKIISKLICRFNLLLKLFNMTIKQWWFKNNKEKKRRTRRNEVKLLFKVQLYARQKQRLVIG